jgi:hypothetical protein
VGTPPTVRVHAAPIARFAGSTPSIILFVDVVLLVTFIGTSGWLLGKEIIGWARC